MDTIPENPGRTARGCRNQSSRHRCSDKLRSYSQWVSASGLQGVSPTVWQDSLDLAETELETGIEDPGRPMGGPERCVHCGPEHGEGTGWGWRSPVAQAGGGQPNYSRVNTCWTPTVVLSCGITHQKVCNNQMARIIKFPNAEFTNWPICPQVQIYRWW